MIYVDICNINAEQYAKLIKYILDRCDEISFRIPGIDYDSKPLLDKEWQTYHRNIRPFLLDCLKCGAKKTHSKHYQNMKLGEYNIIIHVKPFDNIRKMLFANHLYDWSYHNNLPEDVCFYNQKQLYVFSCSHDEEFLFFKHSDSDIEFLESNGYEFRIIK